MNYQDQISSYIDNDLTSEAEQEFLISLAASEGLRRSFRSELVMKDILHKDEAATRPPREMRGAIFGAVGLTAGTTSAGSAGSGVRTFLGRVLAGTKMNLLVGSVMVTLSMGVGYVAHDLVEPVAQPNVVSAPQHQVLPNSGMSVVPQTNPAGMDHSASTTQPIQTVALKNHLATSHSNHHVATNAKPDNSAVAPGTTSLPGDLNIDPIVNRKSK
jgi:hypothetical protein